MKIKPEHYNKLLDKIKAIPDLRCKYLAHKAYLAIANTAIVGKDKRLRWDMFWSAKVDHDTMSEIYKYANDNHIDTALKAIVRQLEKNGLI